MACYEEMTPDERIYTVLSRIAEALEESNVLMRERIDNDKVADALHLEHMATANRSNEEAEHKRLQLLMALESARMGETESNH